MLYTVMLYTMMLCLIMIMRVYLKSADHKSLWYFLLSKGKCNHILCTILLHHDIIKLT